MRKAKQVQALACAAMAALGVSRLASADQLIYEPFNYTAGQPITGQVNTSSANTLTWFQAGTAATTGSQDLHQVGTTGLAWPAAFPATAGGNMADLKQTDVKEYERLNIPNAFVGTTATPKYGANSTLYYSLLLNVPSTAGLTVANTNSNANNDGIIAFNNVQGSQAGRPSAWMGELVIRQGATSGTYNLGIHASTTTNNTAYFTGDLTPGVTHLIVVQVTLGANPGTNTQDTNSLWVDPAPSTYGATEGTRPNPDGSSNGANSATDSVVSMQSIIIGSGIGTGAVPNDVYADEILVGDTWADVTVPEPSAFAFLGVGALGLLRRRRR